MGCDFFYSGKLPDKSLQEKVIKWAIDYYKEKAVLISPRSEEYLTEYVLNDSLQYPGGLNMYEEIMYRQEHGTKRMQYPFNYYGVISLYGWELDEHGQIVFDRSAEGRLVRFLKLPERAGLQARDESYEKHDAEVVVKEGGYDRIIGSSLHFALLLRVMNLRWFTGLKVGDDYNYYETVNNVLQYSGLEKTFKDESMNYQQCWGLFKIEYDKRSSLDGFF